VATTLPKTNAGFCVSTVSIVSGRDHGSVAVVAGGTERRLARPRIVVCVADDADGADGIFRPRMDPDHSGSSSAFTTEGNLNSPYSKERLRTTQADEAELRVDKTPVLTLRWPFVHYDQMATLLVFTA
jgi:hypothetical protein